MLCKQSPVYLTKKYEKLKFDQNREHVTFKKNISEEKYRYQNIFISQTTTTQSNNTTSNNSCLNQDQSTEMTRQGAFFMELQGTSLSDNSNFTQQQVS